MRRWWSAALLLALSTLLALLPAGVAAAAPTAPGAPTAPSASPPGTDPVVVIGIPDLRWQDLDPARTPTLWNLAGRSSVGLLTDNSGEGVARRAAGWLTLNTGSRAVGHVPPLLTPDPSDPDQLWDLRYYNSTSRYAAQVGALGEALRGAGLATAAVGGPGAVLGAMALDGTVGTEATSVAAAAASADVVMVELPELYAMNRQDPEAVQAGLTVVDDSVSRVLQEMPENASLLVVGVSDGAEGPAHLHVAMASGPAFGHGLLTSASTGRAGVVQLIDVAPTILSLKGITPPSTMLGVPWTTSAGSRTSTAAQVADFVDLDERSVMVLAAVSGWYYPAVVGIALLFVLTTLLAWRRGRTGFLRPLGAFIASVPIASYLIQLVPWWRVGPWLMGPLTLAFAALIGALAAFLPWARRGRWRTPALVGGLTAAVVALDAATGSPLSLDGPFADNPIVAGRFHGIGNVAFALLGAGTLVFATAVTGRLAPRRAGAVSLALGLGAVVIDGYPGLGDDFGGVLALLPAVAVLAIGLSQIRVSWRHVAAVLGATVLVTASFAGYDYSRPASERTHLGRFVAQLADGSAETVVLRKAATSLGSFTWGYGRYVVLGWVVLALVAFAWHRRGRLRVAADVGPRRAGVLLVALTVLGVLGAALNDSGLEVTAFTFFLAAPLLVPFLEPAVRRSPPHRPAADVVLNREEVGQP